MNPESETDLVAAFVVALNGIRNCSVESVKRDVVTSSGALDAVIQARIAGRRTTLAVEAKKNGFPRDVRQGVWQLRRLIEALAHGRNVESIVPIIAVSNLSPGGKDLLHETDFGYFDGDGNMFVPANNAFLYIEKPPSKQSARIVEAVFSGRRARAVHAVWLKADAWFGVHDIAALAEVSPATASETLKALEQREWVRSKGSGPAKLRQLIAPQALLDAWAEYQREAPTPKARHYYVSTPDVDWLTYRLHDACEARDVPYEVTGQVAAQSYAPFLTHITKVHCRIAASRQEEILAAIEARPVREGWNLAVLDMSPAETFAFRQRDQMRWLADVLQTYLDLLKEGGRSEEMARHLRAEQLGV